MTASTPIEIVTRMHYDHETATEADLVLELTVSRFELAALESVDAGMFLQTQNYRRAAAALIAQRRPEIVAALAAASEQRG